jgi:hypothetical protein
MAEMRRLGAFARISVLAMVGGQVCIVAAIKPGALQRSSS